jgi:hypothetical protein
VDVSEIAKRTHATERQVRIVAEYLEIPAVTRRRIEAAARGEGLLGPSERRAAVPESEGAE